MDKNSSEWKLENEWLEKVVKEAKKQFNEKHDLKEKFKKDVIETQREQWEEIGLVSIDNGLEQIVDFMGFINTMKAQKRNHESTRKLEEKYEKMIISPYFGRIDFYENGENQPEKYYIGITNLINDDYDFLVYDWRAPVSSMFYDYKIGEARYKCPEGVIEGKLTLKKQYKINNSELEYMFDSNLKIDDEILQDMLSKNTDNKMNAIVTTIQREQNKIIRNEEYKNLIVQGPAGSGKTSIALHRIAYLLYKHRDKITPKNIVIFSPNEIFNEYISNVLPQLGEENMCQTTFQEYMNKALGSGFKKEVYCNMMEYIFSSKNKTSYEERIMSIKYKSSIEFIDLLKKYVVYIEKLERNFKDITFRDNIIISATELEELFFKEYNKLPLKRRLQKIRERMLFLIDPYKKQRIKEINIKLINSGDYMDKIEVIERSVEIVKYEMKDIYNGINKITEFNLIDIYKNLLEKLELFSKYINTEYSEDQIIKIKKYTLENIKAKTLNYEDQIVLLYLKGAFGDIPKTSEIKYMIIDEAQDYTPLQYEIFYQLFNHANITILGDVNQSINSYMNIGSYKNISNIFPKEKTCTINLTKSYRSTMEITEFARKLLNNNIVDKCVERRGDEPLIRHFSKEEDIKMRIIEDVKLYKERGYKSIGIITKNVNEANEVYSYLKGKISVFSIMKDDDEYVSDAVVIPAYLSKGLEFDVVLIYNANDENYNSEDERLLLYTVCTRALHILNVNYLGKISPLFKLKNK